MFVFFSFLVVLRLCLVVNLVIFESRFLVDFRGV